MDRPTSRAGGRATEDGMRFQVRVGTWFAAHLVAGLPVGARFGVSAKSIPIKLQFETGSFLDDIVVQLSDSGQIMVQCKTRPNLSASPKSGFAATVAQLVELRTSLSRDCASSEIANELSAVLAVSSKAPRSLDALEDACRFFDHGGNWEDGKQTLSKSRLRALERFESHARRAWLEATNGEATEIDLVWLARTFRIVRFDVDEGGADRREAARILGTRLFGLEEQGSEAIGLLESTIRQLTISGAPTTAHGVIDALRKAGLEDTRNPRFERDLRHVREYTAAEVERLRRHSVLPIAEGVHLARKCLTPLKVAIEGGSVLVVGEPGAGKTGVLVAIAMEMLDRNDPLIFLSADRLAGVATRNDLKDELALEHDLLDVLAAWPGTAPGTLIIDALDASRGGTSERVLSDLIEDGLRKIGHRWSIVASIRTFDLLNGKRLRGIAAGNPPFDAFVEPGLEQVRHFRIPRLSEDEVEDVAQRRPELHALFKSAPSSVRDLLLNFFNLALAVELLEDGALAESIQTIETQSDLIDRYENLRLPSGKLRCAAEDAVEVMVNRHRLYVPRIKVKNDAIDEVLASGVMALAGERVAFTHHVLFDHVAGRFYLEWDDTARLRDQLANDPAIGLLLGPSLRFAVERIWREDTNGRPKTWDLIASLAASNDIDPIIVGVALRTVAELIADSEDVDALCELLLRIDKAAELGSALSSLARYVSMSISSGNADIASASAAWAKVAQTAISTGIPQFIDGAQYLLRTLSDNMDSVGESGKQDLGAASRSLLEFALSKEASTQLLVTSAIRLVCRTFATDPAASKALLVDILDEPRFSRRAHEEAQWLAEGVQFIARTDPEFVAQIYDVLFRRPAPQTGTSWFGGVPNGILPLTSTREQDYEHSRWRLGRAFPEFLSAAPHEATRAASMAAIGTASLHSQGEPKPVCEIEFKEGNLRIVETNPYPKDWTKDQQKEGKPSERILAEFAKFLRECPEEDFRISVDAAIKDTSATSVWARLLGIGALRSGIADDPLWEIASLPEFLRLPGVSRDAIEFLASAHPRRTRAQQADFEKVLSSSASTGSNKEANWMRSLVARFLSVVPQGTLATKEMRQLRSELDSENRLAGNPPFLSTTLMANPASEIEDLLLTRAGVNLEDGPDHELRSVARSLDKLLASRSNEAETSDVSNLWRSTIQVVATIDRLVNPAPHEQVLHAAWGSISNAVERICESEEYDPTAADHPQLPELLELLARLSQSDYPAESEQDGSGLMGSDYMSWGGHDVRVFASSAFVLLASRFGDSEATLVPRLKPFLSDPVPAVRLQVVQSLHALRSHSSPQMWELVEFVACEEGRLGLLGMLVAESLYRLSDSEPELCEALTEKILDRSSLMLGEAGEDERTSFCSAISLVAARLWIFGGSERAHAWIAAWTEDVVQWNIYLRPLISSLSEVLFYRYKQNGDAAAAVQKQAMEVLDGVVDAASQKVAEALHTLSDQNSDETKRQRAEKLHESGDSLLDHACRQLYFGTGASERNSGKLSGLSTPEAMRQFLHDYADTLDTIGQACNASTLYSLVKIYEFLAAAEPEFVFDRVSGLLVGPATKEGFHHESLASEAVVRLVRRYLADHRPIFDDEKRRLRLVGVMEVFAKAGWPDALRLLYELPDLLR